jgi:hypothetical protein
MFVLSMGGAWSSASFVPIGIFSVKTESWIFIEE